MLGTSVKKQLSFHEAGNDIERICYEITPKGASEQGIPFECLTLAGQLNNILWKWAFEVYVFKSTEMDSGRYEILKDIFSKLDGLEEAPLICVKHELMELCAIVVKYEKYTLLSASESLFNVEKFMNIGEPSSCDPDHALREIWNVLTPIYWETGQELKEDKDLVSVADE